MWAHLITLAIGIWLMAAPATLGYAGAAATHHQIGGPIVATIAWIACSECTRGIRRANLLLGACLILAPLVFTYESAAAVRNGPIAGAAVAALSTVGGERRTRFGGGWSVLWRRGRT